MTREYCLKQLHALYRKDPWVEAVFTAAGLSADKAAELVLAVYQSNWFDTMTEDYVRLYEGKLGITPTAAQSLEDRRSAIEAKWKSSGKVDLALLQAVADSWKNGEVDVAFAGGKISLTFRSLFGVPEDLDGLLLAISAVKPAHLAVVYALKYLLIRDIHGKMTLSELAATPLSHFAGGE